MERLPMEKLEQYLDQVCQRIGGPRAMRQHVRQELREHLMDAVAQHRAAGLGEEDAVARALEEFGKPEEVRSELEATHGQRLLAVVIEKAMQWKETTMRAKWLWTGGATLGLVAVIALEALFLVFMTMIIVPRFQKLMQDGYVEYAVIEEQGVTWMPAFLGNMQDITDRHTTFIVLGAALVWGLFEWRVRSENKAFMRLAALGFAALVLLVLVVLTAATMLISFTLAMPAMGRMSRPFALEQVAAIEASLGALEEGLAKKDWPAMKDPGEQAAGALERLSQGPALTSFTKWNESPTVDDLRNHVRAARESLRTAQQAIAARDADRATAALGEFRKEFTPVRDASKRPPR